MYKIHHSQHPQAILDLFSKKGNETTCITRQQQHYIVPKSRCKAFENAIAIQGPKKFNQLLTTFNLNYSIHTYKRLLKVYLLNSLE